MHSADIKAALKKAGKTQTAIAAELGITVVTVHLVIEGRVRSERVAKRISKITGLSIDEMWPGKYQDKAA